MSLIISFFKSVDQAATAERRDNPLSLLSFLSRERKRSGASAFGTLSGRSRLIARPPLILATFVASALLAWKCSQSSFACGLRARRQPPRTRALNVPRRASTNIGNRATKKRPPTCANMLVVRKIPGIVLLSHSQIYSTIAAGALNYRVREGNECFCSAMDTGKYKTKK